MFVGVVVGQFDADGQPLDDLDEVAGGVLRRQQGQALAGPHSEAEDPAFELQPAAVHIDLTACPLADAEVGQLRFLEIGVDPDLRKRTDGHETLPHLDVVAGVDVAAGHHAVDIADDAAVSEIQFGLIQVAAGLVDLGLGLLDGGRLGNELGKDAVEVALGILLVEVRDDLFWGRGPRGRKVTELGRALQQFAQCLTNGGKGLVQIGRHLVQLLPRRRHRGEAEAGTYGIDRLQGLFDAGLSDRVRFPKHVKILNGDGRGGQQLLAPSEIGFGQLHGRLPAFESRHGGVQVGDLVVHVFDGMLEFKTIGSGLGHLAADQGLGSRQVRLSRFQGGFLDGYLNPVRLRVEFHQHVPLFHAVVVVHQDLAHLARHAGSNESDVPVDIGVIGGNRVQNRDHPRVKEVSGDRQGNRCRRQQQGLLPSA